MEDDNYWKREKTHGRDARAPLNDSLSEDVSANGEFDAFSSGPFLNPAGEIARHERNLPHWQQDGVWQFVTWRLADSLPQSKLAQWQAERNAWLARHPEPWDDVTKKAYRARRRARLNEWLDAGYGSCVLRRPDCAEVVAGALRYFHGNRYVLGAFVVMPNHVHVLFRPMTGYDLVRNRAQLEELHGEGDQDIGNT